MSITASEIRGLKATMVVHDEYQYMPQWLPEDYLPYDQYEMVRLGRKEYGFRTKGHPGNRYVRCYRCSHLEAQRRFKLMLITRRLMK